MMSCEFDPVQYHFTTIEIHDILSLLQSEIPANSASGSGSGSGSVYSEEEQRHRRMISNRESARRSRQRKKRRLEDLKEQLNQLRVENRDLKNQLTSLVYQCRSVLTENHQLGSEFIHLHSKLSGLSQLLVNMQFQ